MWHPTKIEKIRHAYYILFRNIMFYFVLCCGTIR
nr:MAG TPA: hypothetical protein [Caudoviricetes sp.]